MRLISRFCLASALLLSTTTMRASEHVAPSFEDASHYTANDNHPDEHVDIAAEPFDTKKKESIFRVDYLKFNFLPIQIIVTNNGDRPISLEQARIYFITAAGQVIRAAEPEDVDRRMTNISNTGRKIPMPAPLPPLGGKPKTPDAKIQKDFDEFEYADITVAPHTTKAGFLFYDMQGLASEPLLGANLEFREVEDAGGKQLFSFEIPFDKYLAAEKKK